MTGKLPQTFISLFSPSESSHDVGWETLRLYYIEDQSPLGVTLIGYKIEESEANFKSSF